MKRLLLLLLTFPCLGYSQEKSSPVISDFLIKIANSKSAEDTKFFEDAKKTEAFFTELEKLDPAKKITEANDLQIRKIEESKDKYRSDLFKETVDKKVLKLKDLAAQTSSKTDDQIKQLKSDFNQFYQCRDNLDKAINTLQASNSSAGIAELQKSKVNKCGKDLFIELKGEDMRMLAKRIEIESTVQHFKSIGTYKTKLPLTYVNCESDNDLVNEFFTDKIDRIVQEKIFVDFMLSGGPGNRPLKVVCEKKSAGLLGKKPSVTYDKEEHKLTIVSIEEVKNRLDVWTKHTVLLQPEEAEVNSALSKELPAYLLKNNEECDDPLLMGKN